VGFHAEVVAETEVEAMASVASVVVEAAEGVTVVGVTVAVDAETKRKERGFPSPSSVVW